MKEIDSVTFLVVLKPEWYEIILSAIRKGEFEDIEDFVNKAIEEKLLKFERAGKWF